MMDFGLLFRARERKWREAVPVAVGLLFLLALLLASTLSAQAAGETAAKLVDGQSTAEVNGMNVDLDYPVHVMDGFFWGPVRAVSEGLGATVNWNETTRQATVARGGDVRMRFTVGSSTALVNGSTVTLPGPVHILNDRMQVPLDLLGEGFGLTVQRETAAGTIKYIRPEEASVRDTKVEIHEAGALGSILTDARGMTLYLFARDSGGMSNCYDACEQNWPPLEAVGELQAGPGVTGELGATTRRDGSMQVTYDGMPLYYFIRDMKRGDAVGQGLNDVWYVIQPAQEQDESEQDTPTVDPQTITMDIRDFVFANADLTINVGDSVVWTNRDSIAHTVTGDGLDSGTLLQGSSYRYTFTEAGVYEYICALHPSMMGKVTVR